MDRITTRRSTDRETIGYLADLANWIRRGPKVLVLGFGFMSGAAAVASWLGAQSSSPSQRIGKLEIKVDSGFHSINKELTDMRNVKTQTDEKLDLLLRIGCPTITRADLITACRVQGAIR